MSDAPKTSPGGLQPRWQPLDAVDRRVLGVLVEKAKTTPNAYPLTLNALVTGCNQKSNRYPLMQLEPEDIEDSIYRLRQLGAVAQVEGAGRVNKYRHYAYDWFGVGKVEIAVLTELLLRGAQTEGELRGRAARMEPIADVAALRPILATLKEKGLVLSLTPEGRGHVVCHALYSPRELEKVRVEATAMPWSGDDAGGETAPASERNTASVARTAQAGSSQATVAAQEIQRLHIQLTELRDQVDELTRAMDGLRADFQQLKQDLGA